MVSSKLLLPECRKLVEFCALLAFGQFPFGLYPFLPFKTMQSWIQRSGLHREYFAGPTADHLCNGVTVHGFTQKRLQDEHVQRSLQQLDTILVLRSLRHLDVDMLPSWMKNVYPYIPFAVHLKNVGSLPIPEVDLISAQTRITAKALTDVG